MTDTTHRVISGDTLEGIASANNTTVSALLAQNTDLDTSGELRPGTQVTLIPGQLLSSIAITEKVSLPEEVEIGVQLLIDRNPDADFPLYQGQPYAESGTILTIRTSFTLEELAHVNRIEASDILAVNPTGSASNADGTLSADTQLIPTSLVLAEEGDTLEGIAAAFGRDPDELVQANRRTRPDRTIGKRHPGPDSLGPNRHADHKDHRSQYPQPLGDRQIARPAVRRFSLGNDQAQVPRVLPDAGGLAGYLSCARCPGHCISISTR